MPIKEGVEAQTPLPLSLATRDHARAALARAFEEAAVMPGTLLPHEILAELRDVADHITDEVLAHADDVLAGNGAEPALYLVEHSIDATVLGLSIGRRLLPADSLRSSAPDCSSRTSASSRCRPASSTILARSRRTSGS